MRSLRSLFKLTGPVELGWSDSNALGSRMFGLAPGQKSWDDLQEYHRKMFPIRAFIVYTLIDGFYFNVCGRIKRPLVDAHYWFVSHFVPSRRYHMLDLRQPKPGYRHGWIDSDGQMEYALFNILNNYVEYEMPHKYFPTEEDVANEPEEYGAREVLQHQRNNCLEVQTIHHYWNIERPAEEKQKNELLDKWIEVRHANGECEEAGVLRTKMNALDETSEAKLEEMMIRLIKVRRSMWT